MPRSIIIISLLLVACVSNGDEGILIIKNVAPGAGCTFMASEDEPFFSHGVLTLDDPNFPMPVYVVNPQMKSRITALDTEIDQKTIITSGADVDVSFADTTLFSSSELDDLKSQGLTHFKQLFSAPITPNGGLTDAGFVLLPAALVTAIGGKLPAGGQTEVVSVFTVRGNFSGADVSSQAFQYAVTVGHNLVVNPVACPAATTPRTGNPCNEAQDGVVDCCAGNPMVCPATM
jgi:hypothetical protein